MINIVIFYHYHICYFRFFFFILYSISVPHEIAGKETVMLMDEDTL